MAPDVVPVRAGLSSAGVDDENLGDALMAFVVWAADNGIDAEDALRAAAGRFAGGVRAAEALAAADGVDLAVADETTRARYRQQAGGSVAPGETV